MENCQSSKGEETMKKKWFVNILAIVLLVLLVSACSVVEGILPGGEEEPADSAAADDSGAATPTTDPADSTSSGDPVLGAATVQDIEILILESFPVQVNVQISGVIADDCTTLQDVISQREGDNFNVVVTTQRDPSTSPGGPDCEGSENSFATVHPLDVSGLDAGTYTVDVNGVRGAFTLDVDNVPQEDPAAEEPASEEPAAEPTEASETGTGSFSLTGRVWHDTCINAGDGTDTVPTGCVAADDGSLVADGLLQGETGIEGVLVDLGTGACPASEVLITSATDAQGVFSFGNLQAAEYCLSIDTAGLQNEAILSPGQWSAPAGSDGQVTVQVGDDALADEVLFGWDFELLPINLADCENSFEFVDDLTIPDDTVFPPSASFTKEWQVRNNGTCPWTEEYAVVFVSGDQMEAQEAISLTQEVAVAQTLDIAVDMVAPEEPGTYRGNWQLANAAGEPFGIDGVVDDAFWLQIVVEEGVETPTTPEPGSGAIGGVVWEDFCVNSNPGAGCVESVDAGLFVGDGAFDALDVAWAGITIGLANGACPGDGTVPTNVLETAVTDEDGLYLFDGLDTGTYCIFMDALSPENVDFLIPGNWTWPAQGVGYYSFILDPGEQALDLDFGWDYLE